MVRARVRVWVSACPPDRLSTSRRETATRSPFPLSKAVRIWQLDSRYGMAHVVFAVPLFDAHRAAWSRFPEGQRSKARCTEPSATRSYKSRVGVPVGGGVSVTLKPMRSLRRIAPTSVTTSEVGQESMCSLSATPWGGSRCSGRQVRAGTAPDERATQRAFMLYARKVGAFRQKGRAWKARLTCRRGFVVSRHYSA